MSVSEVDGTFFDSSGRRVPRLRVVWQPDWRWSYRRDVEEHRYTSTYEWRRYGTTRVITRTFLRIGPLRIERVRLSWK